MMTVGGTVPGGHRGAASGSNSTDEQNVGRAKRFLHRQAFDLGTKPP
jgi:hypothetical protein